MLIMLIEILNNDKIGRIRLKSLKKMKEIK